MSLIGCRGEDVGGCIVPACGGVAGRGGGWYCGRLVGSSWYCGRLVGGSWYCGRLVGGG